MATQAINAAAYAAMSKAEREAYNSRFVDAVERLCSEPEVTVNELSDNERIAVGEGCYRRLRAYIQ